MGHAICKETETIKCKLQLLQLFLCSLTFPKIRIRWFQPSARILERAYYTQTQAERTSPKQKFLFGMVKRLCVLGSCTLSFVALCKLRYGKCVPVHIIQRNGISSMESSLLILGMEILTVCCKAYTANDLVQKDKETPRLNVLFITSVEGEEKVYTIARNSISFHIHFFFLFYIKWSAISLTRLRTKFLNLRKAYFRKVGILSQVLKFRWNFMKSEGNKRSLFWGRRAVQKL